MKEDALQLDHISQDLFVVDLDFDSVSPSFVVESPFPPLVRTKLLRYFRRTCFDNLIDIDYAHVNILEPSESSSGELIASLRNQLSRVWMEDILLDLSNFLIFIPQTKEDKAPLILFDAPAFFRGKSDSYLPFLKAFFRTSAFSAYLATLVAQKDVRELCILGDVDK